MAMDDAVLVAHRAGLVWVWNSNLLLPARSGGRVAFLSRRCRSLALSVTLTRDRTVLESCGGAVIWYSCITHPLVLGSSPW